MCGPENIIRTALEELSGCFDDETEANVSELLSSGEPGVALEVLCSQLVEFDVGVSVSVKEQLASAAIIMGITVEELDDLKVV